VTLVLSLGTWCFFYAVAMPLDSGATAVVVGLWMVIVIAAQMIWHRVRKFRKGKGSRETPTA